MWFECAYIRGIQSKSHSEQRQKKDEMCVWIDNPLSVFIYPFCGGHLNIRISAAHKAALGSSLPVSTALLPPPPPASPFLSRWTFSRHLTAFNVNIDCATVVTIVRDFESRTVSRTCECHTSPDSLAIILAYSLFALAYSTWLPIIFRRVSRPAP